MRIAVISDIHGNLTALEAVIADLHRLSPDLIVHGGDLAANGHRPAEVIDRIRELGWPGVQGNTEEMLWMRERMAELEVRAPKLRALLHVLFEDIAPATRRMVGEQRIQALPKEWRHQDLIVMHAGPGDPWRAPSANSDDAELVEAYGNLGPTTVVYGHVHTPYLRRLAKLIVANSGSVGLSYDGDARASYLLIDDGRLAIRRVEYNVEREVRELLGSNYPHARWLAEILRQAKYIAPFE